MKSVKQHLLSQNSLYFILIALGALVSVYFALQSARIFLVNVSLNQRSSARIDRWEVEESASDQYLLAARFTFEEAGQVFHGKTTFSKPAYLNADSAIAALKEKIANPEPRMVWFDSADPNRSSLEKRAIGSMLFRALLSGAVVFHFVILRKKWFRNRSSAVISE
jgi:hypothetical protein